MFNAQSLLFKAYRQRVSIRLNGKGGLRLAPSHAAKPLLAAVRACKPQLLALVTGLEQYGAQDDPLILEALALFNATLQAPMTCQAAFEWDTGKRKAATP
jgi:hypothetical protein